MGPGPLGPWALGPWGCRNRDCSSKNRYSSQKQPIQQQQKPMTLSISDQRISLPNSASVISNSHFGTPLCVQGLQFAKKGFQKALGCPKPQCGQFPHQTTYVCMHVCMYWKATCSKGPMFPKQALQKAPWSPQAKKWPVLSAFLYWEASSLKGFCNFVCLQHALHLGGNSVV